MPNSPSLATRCGAGDGAGMNENSLGAEQRVGDLGFSIASVRVGRGNGFTDSHRTVAVTLRIRNAGSTPLALNYNEDSLSVVDDLGYSYRLNHEDSDYVKGISIATTSRAGTDDVLLPGQTTSVTFIPVRYMRDGETVGNRFDINATFGAYEDHGQGRVRRVRNYAAAFVGIPRSAAAQAVGESVRQSGKNVVDSVLKGLFGN